jgi:hypothetical protein
VAADDETTRAPEPNFRNREPAADDEAPDPDLLPDDAPRGAQTIPMPTQTGATTSPVTGYGETLAGEERPRDEPPPDE